MMGLKSDDLVDDYIVKSLSQYESTLQFDEFGMPLEPNVDLIKLDDTWL